MADLENAHYKRVEQFSAARRAAWSQVTDVDEKVLMPVVNPEFTGHDPWPGMRPEWLMARKPPRSFIVSNGLSNPFHPGPDRWGRDLRLS